MKAYLTEAAIVDLEEIARFIARGSIPAARRFVAALRSHALAVARAPRLYPFAEGFEAAGVHRRLYRDYLIFYRERDGRVEVLHIVHASKDWEALLADVKR